MLETFDVSAMYIFSRWSCELAEIKNYTQL